ncbi:MAG: gamma-glutamyltransferase family protein [Rhodospirillaceae bacterium]|nr:gamma-glutamyltransferase family protein [Rhodospirillaceae bacterium]
MRDIQLPGRSVVHGLNGAAATSSTIATLTAIDMLRAGGNAVDAAIAACAVQCVVEPMSTSIGGDCFMLYQKGGDGPVVGINGSGWSPAGLTVDALIERGIGQIDPDGVESVTVPGAVDAWCAILDAHGTLGIDRVLQPAIACAEDGFTVGEVTRALWAGRLDGLRGNAAASALYLKDGALPETGDVWYSPALGRTLRAIAGRGRDGFYAGPVLDAMLAALKAAGGVHTEEDFAGQRHEPVAPLESGYRGRTVLEIPPNGGGITAQIMLNILEGFDLSALDPVGAERLHLEMEAQRLAYAQRDAFVGDPRRSNVPVEQLLSDDFAAGLRSHIRRDRAIGVLPPAEMPEHRDTVYLTVVDRDLNCVSLINSVYWSFGSCIASEETGVVFQNRGAGFVVEPGHPNCVGPRKRPLHTIIPGMVLNDGACELAFGVMGGPFQPVGQTHVVTNLWDFGMDIQQAIDCPRVFHDGGAIVAERGVPQGTVAGLRALGHTVVPAESPHGGGQGILIDRERGVLSAGSDPRRDGCALGY